MNSKQTEVFNWCSTFCQAHQIAFNFYENEAFVLITLNQAFQVQICFKPYLIAPKQTVFLTYETWKIKQTIVEDLILKTTGKLQVIFARKCTINRIDKSLATDFLEKNHLMGYCNAYYKYGLFYQNQLVMVALFSKARKLQENHPVPFRSYELIRVCSKSNLVVTGGLSKLVKYFCKVNHAKHIMTYIDSRMHSGQAFAKIGFKQQSHEDRHFNKKYVLNLLNQA